MDVFLSMGIAVILEALKAAVKNPEKAKQLRKAMLKIRTQIDLVYGED